MTRQHLKALASLHRRKARRQLGAFLVEGVRSVQSALDANAPLTDLLVSSEWEDADGLARRAAAAGISVSHVPPRDLDRVGDAQTSQGVVAVSRSVVGDALDASGPVVVLDGVQDPGNVGALVRSAAWFGAAAVVADARTADFEGPKAVRAAMGGLWDVELVRVADLAPLLDALRAEGRAVWGADLAGQSLSRWRPAPRDVLVLGSEGHGLSDSVSLRLTGCVSIPGAGARGVESLNVGVAAGILLAHWLSP